MALEDLPDWLPAWCGDQLGDEPVSVLFELRQISAVFGLRLAGGREVVVKAREDDGRAGSCVAAQARLAERGFPCARPLTPVAGVGSLAVHAEEFRPGGEVLRGDSPEVAARCAAAFASAGPPTLAPIESSEAFLVAYQDLRGRLFTAVEQEIAWAASVWMAAYNAREEALHGHTPVCRDALWAQAAERLRRANA
jgi:hypothetical protein